MSASFTINPREIRELSATRTTEPSRLHELARRAEELTVLVERHWGDFGKELQARLAALAYSIVEPPDGVSGRLRALRSAVRYAVIRWREDQDALFDFAIAQRHLVNAILDAVEREDPEYQRALAEAVEGALSEIREGKTETLTDEDTGDWLRRLSDEALK
jgi:hypothetical protein